MEQDNDFMMIVGGKDVGNEVKHDQLWVFERN